MAYWVPNQRNSRTDTEQWLWYETAYGPAGSGSVASNVVSILSPNNGFGTGTFVAPDVVLTVRHQFNGLFDNQLKQSSTVTLEGYGTGTPEQPGFGTPSPNVKSTDIGIITAASNFVPASQISPLAIFGRGAFRDAVDQTRLGYTGASTIGYPELYLPNGQIQPTAKYKLSLPGFRPSGGDQWEASAVIGGEGNSGGPLVIDTQFGSFIGGVFAWANATGVRGSMSPGATAADFPGGGKVGNPANARGVGGTVLTSDVYAAIAEASAPSGKPDNTPGKRGAAEYPTDLFIAGPEADHAVLHWGRNLRLVGGAQNDRLWFARSIVTGNEDDSSRAIRLAGGIETGWLGPNEGPETTKSFYFPESVIRHVRGFTITHDEPSNPVWQAEVEVGLTQHVEDLEGNDSYFSKFGIVYTFESSTKKLMIELKENLDDYGLDPNDEVVVLGRIIIEDFDPGEFGINLHTIGYSAGLFDRQATAASTILLATTEEDIADLPGQSASDQPVSLNGDGNNNSLQGGNGGDVLSAGAGDDHLVGALGDDWLDGGMGNDLLDGGIDFDTLLGGDGSDTLLAGSGNDLLYGGAGDDRADGGPGADSLDGGSGFDVASYAGSASGVFARLDIGLGTFGDAQGDSYAGIEGLIGSAYADILDGNAAANQIFGGDGVDQLTGGAGADLLDGGASFDFARYELAGAGVTARLDLNQGLAGDAAGDVYVGIEGLVGSEFNDVLVGTSAGNYLFGLGGGDYLYSFGGFDELYGGGGADLFVFRAGDLPGAFSTIRDYSAAESDGLLFEGLGAGSLQRYQAGADVVLQLAGGTGGVVVANATLAQVEASLIFT